MLKSCEFGQLSNFMVLCILLSKSWVFHKTHFKGALSFLVFNGRHDIQHPVDRYLNGSRGCSWFLRCLISAIGSLDIHTERVDGNSHLGEKRCSLMHMGAWSHHYKTRQKSCWKFDCGEGVN